MRKSKSVKLPSHYPYLVKSHHLNRNDDEGLFYLFPAPAGSDAPAVGFSFRFREFSLPAGIPLAVSVYQANFKSERKTNAVNNLKA